MLSLIIPAYNEEQRISGCLMPTIEFLNKLNSESEIIVVCDGCTDNTEAAAGAFKKDFNNLKIIKYSSNRGKGFAVKKGMLEAKGNLRIFIDADYAVPIETLTGFLEAVNDGFDLIIGSRGHPSTKIIQHQKFFRELAGKGFGRLQKFILDIPFYDTQCGFKLYTKEAAEFIFNKVKFECSYFDAEAMYIAYFSRMKIKEMPVEWRHDGITRMPVGPVRIADLLKKMFKIKKLHKDTEFYNDRTAPGNH